MNLIEYIDRVFSENGVIAELGGRVLKEQHQYALSVAKTLLYENSIGENAVSFLQADTGIGKSFGYLVPIMIYLAITPNSDDKKFIVSTFTRQLQKQIVSEDIPFIRKILDRLGLPSNQVVSYRMGKQAFFSPTRVKHVCNRISGSELSRKQEMENFLFHALDICEYGSGLWTDYLEDFGDFPHGVTSDDICLLQHQECDNPAFTLHVEKMQMASVIVTNHHSLLNPEITKLNESKVEAVIVDEAHKLSSICQDMFNHRISLNELSQTLHKASLIKELNKDAVNGLICVSTIEQGVKEHPKFQKLDYISVANSHETFEKQKTQVSSLAKLFKSLASRFNKVAGTDALEVEDAELLSKLSNYSQALNNWLNLQENQYQISAFGISPVHKAISIATLNIRGSMLFGHILKRITNKVILTSATLSNAQKTLSFSQTQFGLGLKSFSVIDELSVSPCNYASMNFVLTDTSIPSPIAAIEEDQVVFNTKWLNNTVKMIEAAREDGEPLLVLTVSHAESKRLANLLTNTSEIGVHEKGHTIKEYLSDFIEGRTKVLITSAGWEGLNLRNIDKSQLVKSIVITRIPFAPPNPLMKYALEVFSKTNPKIAARKNNIEWVNSIQEVVAKLKQGLGRGTRAPDDFVTIWFADSRMPHSNKESGGTVLLNAIPDRFLPFYLDATIFEQKRKELFFL